MNKNNRYALLMVASLFAVSANAAPMAYSVNSDSSVEATRDSLYLIDLATGADQFRGKLDAGIGFRTDTEGLAFTPGPNSLLWGIDDDSTSLFQVDISTGIVAQGEIQLLSLRAGGGNDVGMTFACDGSLYFTSVAAQSLYRRDSNGTVRVGDAGALGVNISAIAAIGNPTRLYGLGNGLLENGSKDSPNLYSIDTSSGVAKLIGALSNTDEFKYHEAGLDFDSEGFLWAITDRSQLNNQKSQILQIDVITGAATLIATTVNEAGYESLAISPPGSCVAQENPDDGLPRIPTLSQAGRLSAILVLMLAGMLYLRRRYT